MLNVTYFSTIEQLRREFFKDFKDSSVNEYEELKQQIIDKVNANNRSTEDQLLETSVIIEQLKSRNFLTDIALSLSIAAVVITIILKLNYIAIAIGLALVVAFLSIWALVTSRQNRKQLSYYLFKLECLKSIMNEKT